MASTAAAWKRVFFSVLYKQSALDLSLLPAPLGVVCLVQLVLWCDVVLQGGVSLDALQFHPHFDGSVAHRKPLMNAVLYATLVLLVVDRSDVSV